MSDTPLAEKKRLVFQYYDKLMEEYQKLRVPTGEKDSPARTCKDLASDKPELPSGENFKNAFK